MLSSFYNFFQRTKGAMLFLCIVSTCILIIMTEVTIFLYFGQIHYSCDLSMFSCVLKNILGVLAFYQHVSILLKVFSAFKRRMAFLLWFNHLENFINDFHNEHAYLSEISLFIYNVPWLFLHLLFYLEVLCWYSCLELVYNFLENLFPLLVISLSAYYTLKRNYLFILFTSIEMFKIISQLKFFFI